MITTLLLDLDDTLLKNDDEVFIPGYFERISQYLAEIVPKERMLAQLLAGTAAMLENKNPSLHLKDAFDQVFYQDINISYEELQPHTDRFYAEEFPKLQELTSQFPDSRKMLDFAHSRGLEVVVATNPLYPRTAVEQRLAWAEIPIDQFEYSLITSYENSHFAKPHLEYYAEILAKLGRNPHDAVMVGNDISDDIEPASALGLATFHVRRDSSSDAQAEDLSRAIRWLEQSPEVIDPPTAATPLALLARLKGNLVAFGDLFSDTKKSDWTVKPKPDSWAAIEIITHLRDVEREINFPRIKTILVSEEPFISAVDSDRWADERGYLGNDPSSVIQSLWQARAETIGLLKNESEETWNRPARHAIFGPTNLTELVLIFIEHDLLHLRQLRSVLHRN